MKTTNIITKLLMVGICILFATVMVHAQDGEQKPELLSFIGNGLIGVIIYYATKASTAIMTGNFDWVYWGKDNWKPLTITLVVMTVLSFLYATNPNILNQILAVINFNIDTTEPIGTIAFGTFFSGLMYEILKKFLSKTYVETDGKGKVLR